MSSENTTTLTERIAIAQEALEEADRRREVAQDAVIDFALRAVVAGDPIDEIMAACGYREVADETVVSVWVLMGINAFGGTPRQRFAAWLGNALASRILKDEQA